ncbi:hypothetical protein Tco_0698670, partial [Tanacetum coccineum]
QALIDEPVVAPKPKSSIPYPSRANKQMLREKDDNLASKFVEIFRGLHFELSFRDALLHMPKFDSIEELTLRVDDEAITLKVEVLGFSDSSTSGNPTPSLDPILSTSSPSLTPFEGGDFILEEIEACLTNDSIPPGIDDADFDLEGDLLLLEELLNNDPSSPLPPKELNFEEIKTIKSSIDGPLELELKDLPFHLEYAFLEETDKLPVIIAKYLEDDENHLLNVLKSHKHAIAWKISDIKGIDPQFCTHKILMEDDFKPVVQHQRRVNPKIHEVIKKEVIKLLDAGLIYPIFDSPWVSPVHCVPKKGGMTVVTNEDNELIPTRLVIGWRRTTLLLKRALSSATIEVDRAKVDVIAKLPHPTSVKVGAVLGQRAENVAGDHLSRLENPLQNDPEKKEITETFPLETLGMVIFRGDLNSSWFANIANDLAGNFIVKGMSSQQKKKFFKDVKHVLLDSPHTYLGFVRIK